VPEPAHERVVGSPEQRRGYAPVGDALQKGATAQAPPQIAPCCLNEDLCHAGLMMLPLMLPLMCAAACVRVRVCGFTLQTFFCSASQTGESPVLWKCICSHSLQLQTRFLCFGFPFGVDATQLTTWSADNHPIHVPNMLRGERGERRGVGGPAVTSRGRCPAPGSGPCPAAIRDCG
jgi:hypothetical protein